jgi:hypothetical protein
VAIQEISKEKFASLNLFDHCRAHWDQARERAWFIDTTEQLVGVLLYDADAGMWGYSICRYTDDGEFHRIAVASDFVSADMARLQLIASMRRELAA